MLDPVRIRFRTDSWFKADDAARRARGIETVWFDPEELAGVEPAQPGDCWRSRWALSVDQTAAGMTEGPVAGYAICCPKCLAVHAWTSAVNCAQPREFTYVDNGVTHTGKSCVHSGVGSCWNWTGSPEEGTLGGTPSLHCVESLGGCGWHGYLTNGQLKHC